MEYIMNSDNTVTGYVRNMINGAVTKGPTFKTIDEVTSWFIRSAKSRGHKTWNLEFIPHLVRKVFI